MDRILCFLIYIISAFARFSKALARLGLGSYEEWKPGSPLKILMVGYNGARNTGADARVVAIVDQLRELFGPDKIRITVMTLNEKTLAGYFPEDVRLLRFSSIFPLDLYRACCTHHAAILCEGSALKSTFANALSLFFCEAAGIMDAQKKPCIAYGSEVGKMDAFLRKAASRLCRNTYFITRTRESQKVLESLGLTGHVGTDTAWSYRDALDAEHTDALLKKAGWDGKKPLLGIAVMNPFCWPVRASFGKWVKGLITNTHDGQYDKWYYFSDSPARRRAFRHYIRSIAGAVNLFRQEQDFFPVLIGMERLDAQACRALKKALGIPCAAFLSGECSADIMSGVLLRLSLLITSRYHAAVLSIRNGCPIAAVSIDERLDSLMRELALDRRALLHASDKDLADRLCLTLGNIYGGRKQIHMQLVRKYAQYQIKLDEMGIFLRDYLLAGLGASGDQPLTLRHNH